MIGRERGFTLIEIIAGIVLAGVVGVMLFTFMRSSEEAAVLPHIWVGEEAEVENLMEEIIAEYVCGMNSDSPGAVLTGLFSRFDGVQGVSLEWGDFSGAQWVPGAGDAENILVTIVQGDHSLTTLLTPARTGSDQPLLGY